MTDIKEEVEVNDYWKDNDEQLRMFVEDWCRDVFPMFDYTDAFVKYGWKEIKENIKYVNSDNVE